MFSSPYYCYMSHYSFDYSWLYRKTKGVLHRAGKFLMNKYCLPFFFGALLISNTAFASVVGISSAFEDLTDYRYTIVLSKTTTSAFAAELVQWKCCEVAEHINARKVLNMEPSGIDYLVIGQISDTYTNTVGGFFNPKTAAYATVTIAVIDAVTLNTVYTDSEMAKVIRPYNYKDQPNVESRYVNDAARLAARTLAQRYASSGAIQ